MATPAFPAGLPAAQAPGHAISPGLQFKRTEMQGGPARQRRIYAGVFSGVNVSWIFTNAQLLTYRDFKENTISGGARAFTMDVWLGATFTNALVRFKTADNEKHRGPDSWEVSVEIEILQELPTS